MWCKHEINLAIASENYISQCQSKHKLESLIHLLALELRVKLSKQAKPGNCQPMNQSSYWSCKML